MEILNVKDLTFTYPKEKEPVLKNISFSVNEGEFVVLAGATGSGKSTLLRLLKPEISPLGDRKGRITVFSEEIAEDYEIEKRNVKPSRTGYVCQNPKEQAVTDKVWHELAFGLENMNMKQDAMNLKVAEMAAYFGIEDWFDKRVCELSGGQLQLLNLASVMVMDPDILLLDEPSAQLDPVAANEFFMTLKKLNTDKALTIVIAEHRLEELMPICDRMLIMKNGMLFSDNKVKEVIKNIKKEDEIYEALPTAYRIYNGIKNVGGTGEVPLSVRDGRNFLKRLVTERNMNSRSENDSLKGKSRHDKEEPASQALCFKNVSFRYSKESADALKDLAFTVRTGEIFCILGGNGSGKTTALNVASGLLRPYEGSVNLFGKKLKEYRNGSLYNHCLSMLVQDVKSIFLHNTVREELKSRGALERKEVCDFGLDRLLDKNPYDLSGGEQQLLTLAIVLATEPRILLLDEPTKGLDAYRKKNLAQILLKLKKKGMTIVVVTHDVEFAAVCADRCSLFFKGSMVALGDKEEFFTKNSFYTTGVCRISRGIYEGAVTVDGLISQLNE